MDDIFNLARNKKANDEIREELIARAMKGKTDREKFEIFVREIVNNYTYDYSVVKSPLELDRRRQVNHRAMYKGEAYFGKFVTLLDFYKDTSINVSPTLHLFKAGTCVSYTQELLCLAKEAGVKIKDVHTSEYFYDGYNTMVGAVKVDGVPEIWKTGHVYAVAELDGKPCKIDIAGALVAKDYLKTHKVSPERQKELKSAFLFAEPNAKNPFEELCKQNMEEA